MNHIHLFVGNIHDGERRSLYYQYSLYKRQGDAIKKLHTNRARIDVNKPAVPFCIQLYNDFRSYVKIHGDQFHQDVEGVRGGTRKQTSCVKKYKSKKNQQHLKNELNKYASNFGFIQGTKPYTLFKRGFLRSAKKSFIKACKSVTMKKKK
jgi:hypothetical protein